MKLTTFLFMLTFSTMFGAVSYSQMTTLNLDMKDATIASVLDAIEGQSEFFFLYSSKMIDVNQKVDIQATDKKIDRVLDELFSGKDINYMVKDRQILLVNKDSDMEEVFQQKKVTGTITDETGQGLAGVNIQVEGELIGTMSDGNGNFTLEVPKDDAVLVLSFIGYNTEKISVAGITTVNVQMKPGMQNLDEVVVVGYGTIKKTDLTGSVGTVTSEALTGKGTTTAMSALQGTIPGVNIVSNSARPGGSYTIKIRGQNSMATGNPLYVVDGVVTSDIDFLNPADIERIDILKDASSTAIYGSRGSMGVILVQTKNASNTGNAKMTVTLDSYYGVRKLARIPEFMDGREWIDFRTTAFHSWNTTTNAYTLTTANQSSILLASPVINQRLFDEDYEDWLGLATRDGQQQNHYLNISGNTKDISYNIGFGYQKEEGNFIEESLNRYNAKISVVHKPSKYFQSGATANISQTTSDAGSQYGYRDIMKMPDILHAYDDEGNLIAQPGIKAVLGTGATGNFTSTANPLIELANGTQEKRRYDVVASLFAQVTPIEGLNIKSTISPRLNRTRTGKYYGVVAGNRTVDYASTSNSENFDYTWDNQLSYEKTLGSHHLNATLINSVYSTRSENVTVAAQGLPYKSYWYNIYSGTLVSDDCSSGYSESQMVSFAGRANYDFKGKYFATATVRYDGSSKLKDKWAAFPSFAVAWRASEEDFLKNVGWLSNLKARFSFGYSGNNNISAYTTQISPVTGTNVYYDYNGTTVTGFAPGKPVNQSLTWEKTREINFGIEYGLFSDRITGSFEIYDKNADGLLMARTLTLESGVTSMTDNIGTVSNKGIEFSINTVNVRTRDFYWTTSLAFSYNKNAIEVLYGKKEDVIGESRFIGEPINVVYDYKIDGVWTTADYAAGSTAYYDAANALVYTAKPGEAKTRDANGDGVLSASDKKVLGSPDPNLTGSFTSKMTYKNFDFSFNIFTNQNVFLYDEFSALYGYNTQRGMAKAKFDYYIPPDVPMIDWDNFAVDGSGNATAQWGTSGAGHENAKYPIYKNINGAYYGSNGNYQDASFVKVKNITLGYTFNEELTKRVGLSSFRIYVNVLNPFVFTDYVGWDPEYAASSMTDGNGPANITYQIGINARF